MFLPLIQQNARTMKGTKEFYELMSQFERDFKNSDSNFWVSAHDALKRSEKDSSYFYDNGTVNMVFMAYISGYSYGKSLYEVKP